jgi:hypothetical protein
MMIGFVLLAMIGVAYQESRNVVALIIMFAISEVIGLIILIIGIIVYFKSKRAITESSHSQIQTFLESENDSKFVKRGVEFRVKSEDIMQKVELAQLTKGNRKAMEITHPKIELLFNISADEEREFERKRLLDLKRKSLNKDVTINLDDEEDEDERPAPRGNSKYNLLDAL